MASYAQTALNNLKKKRKATNSFISGFDESTSTNFLNSNTNTTSSFLPSVDDFFGTNQNSGRSTDLDKQISNYETRLNAIGKTKDSRNPIEKLFNLPEDQNFLFDVFEVIGRPQQALFGGINNLVTGEDSFTEGLKEGITGEKTTSGGEILRNLGIGNDDNGEAKLFDPTTWGVDDILGTALDIVADPVDLALWASTVPTGGATAPIAVSKSLTKGAKLVDTASDAAKGAYKLSKANDLVKGASIVSDVNKATSTLSPLELMIKNSDEAKDVLSFVKGAKPTTQKLYKSTLEKGVELAGKATKKAGTIADKGITKGLNIVDNIRNNKLLKASKELGQEINPRYVSTLGDTYDYLKSSIGRATDYSKSLPDNLVSKIKGQDKSIDAASFYAKQSEDQLMNNVKDYVAKKLGRAYKDTDTEAKKLFDNISSDLQTYAERDLNTSLNASDLLRRATTSATKKGANVFDGTEESINQLADYLDKNYKGIIKYNVTRPGSKINNIYTGTKESVEKLDDLVNKDLSGYISSSIKDLGNGKYQLRLNTSKGFNKNNLKVDLNNLNKSERDFLDNYLTYGGTKESRISIKNDQNLKSLVNSGRLNEFDNIKLNKVRYLDDSTLNEYKRIDDLIKNDSDYRNLMESAKSNYKQATKAYSDATGKSIDFSEITDREGYVRRPIEKGAIHLDKAGGPGSSITTKGSKQALSSRKRGLTTSEENVLYRNKKQRIINEAEAKKADLQKNTYDTLKKQYASDVKRIEDAIDIRKSNYEIKLAKKQEKLAGLKEVQKSIDNSLNFIKTNITDDVIKKATKSVDGTIPKQLQNSLNKFTKYNDEFNSLTKKLTSDLSDNELKTVNKQLTKVKNDLVKADKNLRLSVQRARNSIDNKFVKDVNKAANSAEKLAQKSIKQASDLATKSLKKQNAITAYSSHIDDFKKAYQTSSKKLEQTLKKYQIRYEGLKPGSDSKVLEQIGQIDKTLDVLKNTDVDRLFSNNYFEGFDDFIKYTSNNAKSAQTLSNALLNTSLYDEDMIRIVGKDEIIGKLKPHTIRLNAEDANKIASKLDNFKGILGDKSEAIATFKKAVNDGNGIIMDKDIFDLIKSSNSYQEGEKAWEKIFNLFNNNFKRFKVISPGFHVRNITGNTSNLYLSGVPLVEIPSLNKKATKLISSKYIDDLISKYNKGILSKSELKDWKTINGFINAGFLNVGDRIRDLDDLVAKAKNNKGLINKLFSANAKANEYTDRLYRMSAYIYAESNPKYVAKLGAKTPADAVRTVLFDPDNLSPFEKNVVKKIVPFYTFAKQNLVFQSKNIFNNTSRYNRLFKTFNKTYENVGEGRYNQYQKENFEIPLPFTDEKGNIVTLKSNLPVSDLGEYISNPLQRLVSSTSPLIKAPFEQVTGIDTFTGRELDRTPLENILYNTGLDTVTTSQFNKIGKLQDENLSNLEKITALFPSVFRYADSSKIATNSKYQQLQEYQDIMDQLKDQGIDVPTIAELSNNSTVALKRVKDLRNKLKKNR